VYAIIAILIFLNNKASDERFYFHLRFILAAVLVFGGLQKLLEPSYTNGAFFQYQISMGIFLKPIAAILPEWKQATMQNLQLQKSLQQMNPNVDFTQLLIPPFRSVKTVSLIFSWMSIVMEILAGILIYAFPKKHISHLILIITLFSVFIFRLETGFLSLLAALGIAISPSKRFSATYFLLFILFISLVVSGLGLK
jgi:hypothetical protein